MSNNSTKVANLEKKVREMEEMQRDQWGCARIKSPFVEDAHITIASNGHLLRIRGLGLLPLEIPLVPCLRAAGVEPIDLQSPSTPKAYELLIPILQFQAAGGNDMRMATKKNGVRVIKGAIKDLPPPKKGK